MWQEFKSIYCSNLSLFNSTIYQGQKLEKNLDSSILNYFSLQFHVPNMANDFMSG